MMDESLNQEASCSHYNSDFKIKKPHVLFISEEGMSLHFIVYIADIIKRKQLKEIIEERCGCVSFSLSDFSDYTIILVDNILCWSGDQHVFHVSYVDACLKEGCILDISQFLRFKSINLVSDFPFMDVIYFHRFPWDRIPKKYQLELHPECKSDIEDSSSSEQSSSQLSLVYDKRSRSGYTMSEKEQILKYIVKKQLYDKLKGNKLYIAMEQENICPRRTWQSMKEHTLKVLSKQINQFNFLTPHSKSLLKHYLSRKRNTSVAKKVSQHLIQSSEED